MVGMTNQPGTTVSLKKVTKWAAILTVFRHEGLGEKGGVLQWIAIGEKGSLEDNDDFDSLEMTNEEETIDLPEELEEETFGLPEELEEETFGLPEELEEETSKFPVELEEDQ
jgi:hypothetical protein